MGKDKDKEEQELEHVSDNELASRAELPDDQWIHLPKGVSIIDFFHMNEEDKETTKQCGWEEHQERMKELEEDEELAKRVELPESEWETIPEGMTIGEWFKLKRNENDK